MAKYGTGSRNSAGIQAATAALQGMEGNLAGALAGASAPELAHLLKSTEKDLAVNAIAHAILGGAVAANAEVIMSAASAAGTATGELAARAITGMLHPRRGSSQTSVEEQKRAMEYAGNCVQQGWPAVYRKQHRISSSGSTKREECC